MATQAALKNYTDCGVYVIINNISGKKYVGSTASFIKRKSRHLTLLAKNKHPNQHLQSAYNKYGADEFAFQKVIVCPPEDRIFHEQRLMDQYRSYNKNFGYNKSSIAGVSEPTEEVRAKMRAAKLGRPSCNKGTTCSEEKKLKISNANKGNVAWNKGIPWSEDWKKNMSVTKAGIPNFKIRKSHCVRGHEMTGDNLLFDTGGRRCKACVILRRLNKKTGGVL